MNTIGAETKTDQPGSDRPSWLKLISKYERPKRSKAFWQLTDTLVPYFVLWALMILSIRKGYPYWATLAMAVLAGGLLMRIFIFFHDCCHGSFFRSKRANRITGSLLGILCFTPYDDWRYTHWRHHATVANLDYRGEGDVWTMTIEEYMEAPRLQKRLYRVFRNPVVLFGLGPLFYFLIRERFPSKGVGKRERQSVHITNIALLVIALIAAQTMGFWNYARIQLPVLLVSATAGVWLFYVQHQFEGVYWARHDQWDPIKAALQGSSFYKLPRVLQWFSGNIGLHYIHHIQPLIPNYNLKLCYQSIPALQTVPPLTILKSLKSLRLRLWDEQRQKLVSFRALKSLMRNR